MAFHFSLEAVLRVRRGQERVERLKLEAILSEPCRHSGVYELRPVVGQGIIEIGGRLDTQRISLKHKDARQCV